MAGKVYNRGEKRNLCKKGNVIIPMRRIKWQKTMYRMLFILYCLIMLWLLFGRRQYHREMMDLLVNLRPLKTIRAYLYVLQNREEPYLLRIAAFNLFGNVVLFIPYGLFLPVLCNRLRSFWKVMLLGALTIVCVELLQIATLRGSCDIDDLILNMLGILMGYIVFRIGYARRLKGTGPQPE